MPAWCSDGLRLNEYVNYVICTAWGNDRGRIPTAIMQYEFQVRIIDGLYVATSRGRPTPENERGCQTGSYNYLMFYSSTNIYMTFGRIKFFRVTRSIITQQTDCQSLSTLADLGQCRICLTFNYGAELRRRVTKRRRREGANRPGIWRSVVNMLPSGIWGGAQPLRNFVHLRMETSSFSLYNKA